MSAVGSSPKKVFEEMSTQFKCIFTFKCIFCAHTEGSDKKGDLFILNPVSAKLPIPLLITITNMRYKAKNILR